VLLIFIEAVLDNVRSRIDEMMGPTHRLYDMVADPLSEEHWQQLQGV